MSISVDDMLRAEIAPQKRLRAAINLANPLLAQGSAEAPRGISVDLAAEIGRRLGVEVEYVALNAAGTVVEALKSGECDVAFMASDPARASDFSFSPAYFLIEGTYLVGAPSALAQADDVDQASRRIAATKGTAYAQYLARALKSAELLAVDDAFATFRADEAEAVAGIRQALNSYAAAHSDVQVLPGRFMEIYQVIALPVGRERAALFVEELIEELKSSGFVRASLDRSGHPDVLLAPPAAL